MSYPKKLTYIYQKKQIFCVIYLLSRTRLTTLTCSRRLIESTIGSLITWITLPSFVSGKTKTAQETAERLVLVFFLLCQDRVHWGRPGLHKVPLHWQVPEEEVQMQVAEYEVQQQVSLPPPLHSPHPQSHASLSLYSF